MNARLADAHSPLHRADASARSPQPRTSWIGWAALALAWILLVGLGIHARMVHATAAGSRGAAPVIYPPDSLLPPARGAPTLLMFVHPECPCTRASLHELERVVARAAVPVAPVLVVTTMTAAGRTWEETPIAALARRIPRVSIVFDPQAREMQRFGAQTSGHVVLYDAQGQLRFSGGVTGSRGHEGENAGASALKELLTTAGAPAGAPPVFGCLLRERARTERAR